MKKKFNKINRKGEQNRTTNYKISEGIQNREIEEYSEGILPAEHERYLGDYYAMSVSKANNVVCRE